MSYINDFAEAILKHKDEDAAGKYLDSLLGELVGTKYDDIAGWLEGKLDFEDVEFVSEILGTQFPSSNSRYTGPQMLFRIFDLYDDEDVYAQAPTLLKYEEHLGLPDGWDKKLEKFGWLDNFKQNYKKIASGDSFSYYDENMIARIIDDADYDTMDKEQVAVLAELVYYNFSDKKADFINNIGSYPQTRLFNQLAANCDFDYDVMKAIEDNVAGWYVDNLEEQLDKVDMSDMLRQQAKDARDYKRKNALSLADVQEYRTRWKDILTFNYIQGHTGLEDQVNDSIEIIFDGNVIYSDKGRGNDFGDTTLRKDLIDKFLDNNADLAPLTKIFFV